VETYGCWLNKADTDIIIGKLINRGFTLVDRPEEADLIIINTCAVREEAERNELKRIRQLSSSFPGKRIVVAGCLSKVRPASIRDAAPGALLIDANSVEWIDRLIDGSTGMSFADDRPMAELPPYIPSIHGHRYVVPIQVGCLGNCSFCVTKIGRMGMGKVRSYRIEDIVDSVRRAVRGGAREIYLTGQEVSAYGRDRGYDLADLLERILDEVPGRYLIRLGMMEPMELSTIIDRLLDIIKEDWRVYRFFHVPVQSGSDKVLRLMRRKYSVELFKELVRKIRKAFPESTVVTDIIVGHPGESDEDFRESVELIKELSIDKVNLARYSRRPFTEAAYMDQVPEEVKKMRSSMAARVFREVSMRRNQEFVGSELWGIVSETDPGNRGYIIRAHNYKPVLVSEAHLGAFARVKVRGATPHRLLGDLIQDEAVSYVADIRLRDYD